MVADPGVYVSGLISGGESPPAVLVDLAEAGRVEVLTCPALSAELCRVLLRPKFRRWFTEEAARELLARLEAIATQCDDPPDGGLRTRDPKDDYLLALAQATDADAVVSGDGDLHEADQDVVAVWTPREAVERLG